ncbi:MAG TPA: inositol monophosphatase family protein [Syntrophorhabdaceae bacterium]|nr:inositol monophosphatase family protein [Syntrophorhabdaceae bacterium]
MEDLLKFAVRCAMESGRIQRKYYEKEFAIHHKGEINLVTDVDLACQDRIVRLIRKKFPDDNIISEEQSNRFEADGNRWIIDPLDGTTNFAHGYPFFCTSIAYEVKGKVVLGVIYNPIFRELFVSERGKGAYLNGRRIHVSRTDELKKSLLTTGFPYDVATSKDNNIDHFVHFLFEAQAIRRDGSAALNLCYTACGRFDGFWEMKLNPWDIAAGALMVEEAGGQVSGIVGKKLNYYKGEIVASNGIIHKKMLKVLK